MTIVLTLIGFIVGAATLGLWPGVVFGAVGYLLGAMGTVRARLAVQSLELEQLRLDVQRLQPSVSPVEASSAATPAIAEAPIKPVPEPASPAEPRPSEAPTTAARTEPVIAAEPAPRLTPSPVKPTVVERAVAAVREFVLGGNAAVRVGVAVLIVGVSLLARFAADHGYLPIQVRLVAAAMIGIAMISVGWRVRQTRPAFGTTLQGGGIAALYVTTFFALKIYELIPAPLAFVVLVGLTVFSGALAVLQDARVLAVFGAVGGFLAPIIASTGRGDHVLLFSYYALLNAGIVGVAWFRAWRGLNLIGFMATFGIGTLWGTLRYRPDHFATTEPFLVLFFVFYVAVAILFALRQPPRLRGLMDGTIVFGTPLVAFGLQASLVGRFDYGLAWTALTAGLFYATVATALLSRAPSSLRPLVEAFLALAVGFGTLAIPFAFDDQHLIAASWALEGVGLMWVGFRQHRRLAQLSGAALQLLAGAAYVLERSYRTDQLPIVNGAFMAAAIIGVCGIAIAWLLERGRDRAQALSPISVKFYLVWGLGWWLGGGVGEIHDWLARRDRVPTDLLLFAVTALVLELIATRIEFRAGRRATLFLIPVAYPFLVAALGATEHPLTHGGQLVWPLAVGVGYALLRRQESELGASVVKLLHLLSLWLVAILVLWEGTWQVEHLVATTSAWPTAAFGVLAAAFILTVCALRDSPRWPLASHRATYLLGGLGAVVAVSCLWALATALVSRGDPAPLPFVPILNPIDLAIGLVIATIVTWLRTVDRNSLDTIGGKRGAAWILGLVGFAWLNGTLARTVHHWAGVPFTSDDLFDSMVMQATLSMAWTLAALALMIVGTKRRTRTPWMVGAALLAVVVAKLFFVDLSTFGSGWKIISFLVVGTLMVVVGWFAPVPPSRPADSESTPQESTPQEPTE